MINFLRAKTIEHKAARGWSNLVKDRAFLTNTKFKQIQGFLLLELMLRFEPQQIHYDLHTVNQLLHTKMLDQEIPCYTYQIFTALEDERYYLALDAIAYMHYQKSRTATKQKLPKKEDLVVVQNYAINSQKRRK